MNTKKIAIAVAMLCSSFATVAQDYNPSWYIQPSVDAVRPDSTFTSDERGYGVGLRFGKPVSDAWDIQMGTTFARARDNGNTYFQNTVGADALYMFSRKAFRPFVLVGVGAERDRANMTINGYEARTSPYANVGMGFQASITDQWAFQADLRDVHGFLHGSDFGSKSSNNTYLTLALNYSFDKPTPPPAPAPMPAPVAEVTPPPAPPAPPAPAHFEKVTMSATELFAFNSAKLNAPQPKLDGIADALNATPEINNVVITGYADRIGSRKYNQKLSERRAESVKAYLVSKGVNASRLNAVGKGETNPVVECHDKKRPALIKCLEPNRRVEIEQITVEHQVQ